MRERRFLNVASLMVVVVLASCGASDRGPTVRIFDGSQNASNPGSQFPAAPSGVLRQAANGGHTVRRGDTLYSISRAYGVNLRALIELNRLSPPYTLSVGQVLLLPMSDSHIVARGETVYGISRRYGVAMNELVRANAIAPPFTIKVGQRLVIPAAFVANRTAAPAPLPRIDPRPPAPAAPSPSVSQGTLPPQPSPSPPPSPSLPPVADAPRGAVNGLPLPTAKPPPPGRDSPVSGPTTSGQTVPASGNTPSVPATVVRAPDEKGVFLADGTFLPPLKPSPPPRLVGPISRPPALSGRGFLWPTRGRIISGFGPQPAGLHNDGINIAAPRGTPVRAAEAGVVAYAGEGLPGLGKMILIRHADGYVTAYGHADTLLATRGQIIQRGQAIARAGSTGTVDTPQVHFQIRRGRQAIDPRKVLLNS